MLLPCLKHTLQVHAPRFHDAVVLLLNPVWHHATHHPAQAPWARPCAGRAAPQHPPALCAWHCPWRARRRRQVRWGAGPGGVGLRVGWDQCRTAHVKLLLGLRLRLRLTD